VLSNPDDLVFGQLPKLIQYTPIDRFLADVTEIDEFRAKQLFDGGDCFDLAQAVTLPKLSNHPLSNFLGRCHRNNLDVDVSPK